MARQRDIKIFPFSIFRLLKFLFLHKIIVPLTESRLKLKFGLILLAAMLITLPVLTHAKAPDLSIKELQVAPPRIIRTCCGFGADVGIIGVPFAKRTNITSREKIGSHVYMGDKTENNGNIYTRLGGFIDLGHLRDCADWTAYLYSLMTASRENTELQKIGLRNEGGSKTLELNIPENFTENELIKLAGKIAYDLSLWHEISTWFGASYVPLVPERFSSFSPEDMYSNLLGVYLGMKAIKSELGYNEAMTFELDHMLDLLESATSEEETYNAMLMVNDVWYTNKKKFPNKKVTIKRYLDVESELTPWLIPGEKVNEPYVLKKPDHQLSEYFELSLKLNFRFPVDSIIPENNNRVITQNDFDYFVEYIQNELGAEDEKRLKRITRKEKISYQKTNS
jgi:hypothetical protein